MRPEWDGLSDAELLKRSQSEPDAFGVFYDRHAKRVLGYLYRRTASAEMAADLTAETFAQALTSRNRFRPVGETAIPWLLKIAQRQLSRALRRRVIEDRARTRLGIQRIDLDDLSLERIEALIDFAPLSAAIREALASLPSSLADAVSLRVAHNLPYAEVARRLGCSEGAARVRVARGLSKLSARLEES
ncbi:MAG: RNA polymerase sigma factor [Actinomycetota bacterium]|nr:RNA polymerase sigma factor [Actinomycetota bacterium]